MRIYFDHASTTALDSQVLDAMLPYMTTHFGNASSMHHYGRIAKSAIEAERKKIAQYLNVSPSEIFFTSSGTEANNWAIRSALQGLKVQHYISTPIEHQSILKPLATIEKEQNIGLHYLQIDKRGNISLIELEKLLKKYPKALVCLSHANSELGNINDIATISDLCQKYGCFCFIDAIQTIGYCSVDLKNMPIHFLSASAHKFYGPKGVGFIYVDKKTSTYMKPLIFGGSQENNLRAGTECVANIVGLGKALEIIWQNNIDLTKHLYTLKTHAIKMLKKQIPTILFNGKCEHKNQSIDKILSIALPSTQDQAMLLFYLDIQGIAVSAGSACSSGTHKMSHVLSYLHIPDNYIVIRISFGKKNTIQEIEDFIKILKKKC